MNRLSPFLALTLFLFGCSRRGDTLAGYDKQSGDLGAFILQHASKFGVRVQNTNGLPQLTAEWRHTEGPDSCQISVVGDYLGPLQSFLTAAFGPPAHPLTTNETADMKQVGTHYGPELGSWFDYAWVMNKRDGRQFTSVGFVRMKWYEDKKPTP